jgi:hypothetical protein
MDANWNFLEPEVGGKWDYWQRCFPISLRIYGSPILLGDVNLDFLANCLNESPAKLIYYPIEERFYFRDYLFENAYRPTSEGKVSALVRKLVRDSVEDSPRSLQNGVKAILPLADMATSRARTILAVESHYFVGEDGERRWENGKFIEPVEKPTIEMFIAERVTRKKGQVLTTPLAYQFYYAFCREVGLPPVKKTIFTDRFAQEVKKKWKLGVRNDLKVDGRTHQGWGELAVM